MVALQEDRPRLIHLAVQFPAGGLVTLDVIMNLDAIQGHGDPVADNGGLGGLPLAAGLGDELVGALKL